MNPSIVNNGALYNKVEHAGLIKLLQFRVADIIFCVEVNGINEIIEYGKITSVPLSPLCIKGVYNLRGSVVPVVDMAMRLGKKSSKETKRTCIIIFETYYDNKLEKIGFVVDSVDKVMDVEPGHIDSPPAFGADIRAEFISGIVKEEGWMVTCLDLEAVLSIDELSDMFTDSQSHHNPVKY